MRKLSVILTVAPPWENLPDALESLRRQTLRDWEVVCVLPEGTPEEAQNRVTRFCAGNPHRTVLSVPADTPFIQQRNIGLQAAAGQYVAFLHSKNRFTPRFLSGLYRAAKKDDAALVVGRQRAFGALGRRDFSSAEELSLRRTLPCTEPRLLWNPSVSNKLYRLADIRALGLTFRADFGYAADALFTLAFALGTGSVASARQGYAQWREEPFTDSTPTKRELESYLTAYAQIEQAAEDYFDARRHKARSSFAQSENERKRGAYLDEVRGKLLTVLIYRYYRHFYAIDEPLLSAAVREIVRLYDQLSESAKSTLRRAHSDILLEGNLPTSLEQAAETRKVTVLLCGKRSADELAAQLESLFAQSLPFFALLIDSALRPLCPAAALQDPRVRWIDAAEGTTEAIKQAALDAAQTSYLLILERPALLDTKALQRHVHALKAEPEAGFSTAPFSHFDGQRVSEYPSTEVYFQDKNKDHGRLRATQTPRFPLDLLWENKLLRVRHLRGVHFAFSAESAHDCHRLYANASFVRLKETALYLTLTQEELLALFRREGALLPPEARSQIRAVRLRFLGVRGHRFRRAARQQLRSWANLAERGALAALRTVFGALPLRDEVLFFTTRPLPKTRNRKSEQDRLPEDLRLVYAEILGKKHIFAHALPHTLRQKVRSLWCLQRAKILVTDGTIPTLARCRLRPEQRVLQIWHACGAYKRFALDAPLVRPRHLEQRAHAQYTAAVVSSEDCRDAAAHAFGIDPARVLALGAPHTDRLLDAEALHRRRERVLRQHPVLRGKKIYLYAPTARARAFDPKIRWKTLSQTLAEDEMFIIHRHPLQGETYISGRHYRRVRDYTAEALVDLLAVCDVLVTDYSAVVQEAALMGVPTLFYCPDWEDYERDFYLRFPDDLPGKLITDAAALPDALRDTLAHPKTAKLAAFAHKQMGACDGHSTARVAALIKTWQTSGGA
ncbi:MAG: bifunctional glycosyltransferase family 2 protein/CDP-glycerol:glycerophosphate glycerophosphotransferase [Oscillospiraceae bacterium]|nr:bifunctional glycosyltransferase family 2 protein/CDP-glycerol:glycerophosphate glycerophosphotransferase [Oscillospiraceae bacterium]